MNRRIEVLSPAGGRPALEAAVRAGADAVYLGGPQFGARANAQNFSLEELSQAVKYCHERGARVHVTVNTLLKDGELPEALALVRHLCCIHADAVLVQDMGLISLIRERAPELILHASTQMSLHTPAGVRLVKELGLSRAVLARELSLPEIREIGDSVDIELESFVHGALCMCVSGQCYLSAMLGGRSGNRGQCAQPCRLPFKAPVGTGHDLSLKDLSFINSMDKLCEAGVCSAKIEGRMKRPEYVAAVTAACRLAADGKPVPKELSGALEAVFSRSGFTDGYLTGRMGREMFGTRTKEDVTAATEKVLSSLRELYRSERQCVPVDFTLSVQDNVFTLSASCGGSLVFVTAKADPKAPIYNSIPKERCISQLQKTGGTPFTVRSVTVPEEGAAMPVSELNGLRRRALQSLLEARGQRRPIPFTDAPIPSPSPFHRPQGPLPVRAVLRDIGQFCRSMTDCEAVCLPIETPAEKLSALRYEGVRLILDLPRAMFGREGELRELMENRKALGFTEYLCGNLGALELCRELGVSAHGGFSLNIANTPALKAFEDLGLKSAELSFELSGREISGLGAGLPRGVTAYGRQPLMLTRSCPLANSPRGCLRCKVPGSLTDRKGKSFPVICREHGKYGVELLNSVPLWLGDMQQELACDFAVLRFTVENSVECGEIFRAFRSGESLNAAYTRGLFRRGVV